MNFLLYVLLSLPFMLIGIKLLRSSAQFFFSLKIHKGLLSKEDVRLISIFTGALGSLLLLSSSIYNRLLLNLVQGRLISFEKAINLSLGSLLGSFLIVIPFLKTDVVLSYVLMTCGSFGLLWIKNSIWRNISRAILGTGLIYFGLYFGKHFLHTGGFILSPAYAFLAGIIFVLLFRSSGLALIIGLWCLGEGSSVSPFMYASGVLFGASFPELLKSKKRSIEGKQIIFILFMQRLLACALALGAALWLSDKEGLISKWDGLFFYIFMVCISTFLIYMLKEKLTWLSSKVFRLEEYPEGPKFETADIEDATAAISLVQARRQVEKMANITQRLILKVETYLSAEADPRLLGKIKKYERVTDNMKVEVENFLREIMKSDLTNSETKEILLLLRLVSKIESIADYLDKLATYKTRLEADVNFSKEFILEFKAVFLEVKSFYLSVINLLGVRGLKADKELLKQSAAIKLNIDKLREEHLFRLEQVTSSSASWSTYSDMFIALRRINGHSQKMLTNL